MAIDLELSEKIEVSERGAPSEGRVSVSIVSKVLQLYAGHEWNDSSLAVHQSASFKISTIFYTVPT